MPPTIIKEQPLTCSLCGFQYYSELHAACPACPMNSGCTMVCCPSCGYSTIDPGRSGIARLADFLRRSPLKQKRKKWKRLAGELTLADIPPQGRGRVLGFKDLTSDQLAQLHAYGLTPGRIVSVLQQKPVTVVQIEHTELAFEGKVARGVLVGFDRDVDSEQSNG